MKFYSELTKKFYGTAEECLNAEEEYRKHLEAENARKKEEEKRQEAELRELEDLKRKYMVLNKECEKVFQELMRKSANYKHKYGKDTTLDQLIKLLFR